MSAVEDQGQSVAFGKLQEFLQVQHGGTRAQGELITVLQTQMRHAGVSTTLKVPAHLIPQSQRDPMARIAKRLSRGRLLCASDSHGLRRYRARMISELSLVHEVRWIQPQDIT